MDKQALLDALAQSGSAGKAAYEQAQAELARQQQAAIQGALASGVAGNAPSGAQSQLQQIISQPYQSRMAQLTQNQASQQDWYNRLGAATGAWADQQQALQQAALASALAKATGGGGGGGGGGAGDGSTFDWYQNLKDMYGTGEIGKSTVINEAMTSGNADWRTTGVSPTQARRDYLSYVYGIPQDVAAGWIPETEFQTGFAPALQSIQAKQFTPKQVARTIVSANRQSERTSDPNAAYTVARIRQAARDTYNYRKVRKRLPQARKFVKRKEQQG